MDTDTSAKEANRAVRNMVRHGTVSSTNQEMMMARVVFEEKDGNVSAELHVLTRGSGGNRDYWMPDVGDEVVCLYQADDEESATGWILGTYFTEKHKPNASSQDIRRIDFGDGSFFEFNRAAGSLTIKCTGPIKVNGSTINLN